MQKIKLAEPSEGKQLFQATKTYVLLGQKEIGRSEVQADEVRIWTKGGEGGVFDRP